MTTIYKYPIHFTIPQQPIKLPKGATPLQLGPDPFGDLCMWALVDTDHVTEEMTLFIVGTGERMPEKAKTFVGTTVQGEYVWHVFLS